jgi:hypothetical protein
MGRPRPFGQLRRMVLAAGGVKRFLDIVPGVCRLVQVGVPCSPTACHVAAEAARATSPRKPCTDPAHPTRPLTKGPAPVRACLRLIQRDRAEPQAVLLRGRARRSSARAVELRTPRHQRLLTAVLPEVPDRHDPGPRQRSLDVPDPPRPSIGRNLVRARRSQARHQRERRPPQPRPPGPQTILSRRAERDPSTPNPVYLAPATRPDRDPPRPMGSP